MTECLPDLPRYINQREDGSWHGADDREGPWRPIPAPRSGLPWKTDGPAVQSSEPASVAAEARPLSPAAQAVLDAYETTPGTSPALAAALCAVADQILIRPGIPSSEYSTLMRIIDGQFRAIAAELEAQP